MTDFTSLSRRDWLDLADRFYDRIGSTAERFTPEEWNRRTPYLGWRARDVLAHLTGASRVNFRPMIQRALAGDPSPPPEFDTFTRNAREVARSRWRSTDELLAEFRTEIAELLPIYRGMSDSEWIKPAWFFVGPVMVRDLFFVQLADGLFHERDMLLVNGRWRGLDPLYVDPLMDWFMRVYRPATFRPERAKRLRACVLYQLTGVGGGEWTMIVDEERCHVTPGAAEGADVRVQAEVESLIAAALARAAPVIGRLGRAVSGAASLERGERITAAITGAASLLGATAGRRIKLQGNLRKACRVQRAFWHFWQRPRQTEENIRRGRAGKVSSRAGGSSSTGER